jgi:glycosyltransferase involved in cell wall biosynthesis
MSRRAKRHYDVVFYMPWIGPLLAEGAPLPTGGAETQIFLVANALADRGARVCLVAYDGDGTLPERVGRVDIVSRPAYGGQARWVGKIRETLSIWRALGGIDSDVIVTRAFGPHVGIIAMVARVKRRRFVYSSAHVADFTLELEDKRRNLALYRLGMRLASTIVVQTEEQVDLCRRTFGCESVLIRSYGEPADVTGGTPEAFLWVARAVWYKQPLKFLELARRVPEARFWMVAVPGEGFGDELVEQIRSEAAEIPNLELLDPRPRAELGRLMERAVAIVNTADFEGLPNIFLEGWARGVPAMTLSHDPDGIVARERIGSYAGGSIDEMAAQVRELWSQRADLEALRERCRAYVQDNHSPEVVAGKWLQVLGLTGSGAEARPTSQSPALVGASNPPTSRLDTNEVA